MGPVRSGDSRLIQWWDLGDSDLCFSLSAASAVGDVVWNRAHDAETAVVVR